MLEIQHCTKSRLAKHARASTISKLTISIEFGWAFGHSQQCRCLQSSVLARHIKCTEEDLWTGSDPFFTSLTEVLKSKRPRNIWFSLWSTWTTNIAANFQGRTIAEATLNTMCPAETCNCVLCLLCPCWTIMLQYFGRHLLPWSHARRAEVLLHPYNSYLETMKHIWGCPSFISSFAPSMIWLDGMTRDYHTDVSCLWIWPQQVDAIAPFSVWRQNTLYRDMSDPDLL